MVVVKITHVQTHFAKGQLNRKLLSALHIAANGQTQSAPPLFDDMKKKMRTDFHQMTTVPHFYKCVMLQMHNFIRL